ncbi:hypothetical protein OSB04_006079 [Centaurea solstitialis]|uniref:Leucine-rich repeat-containing N-terminal plant-type domain-containing protein n=1 Tax=Centaurea solstitialis TaxID=347529 RepID=A0AA38TJ00_9ASTR|nr:hypothetical protein OSB04_006079 [Centaurea solstitialis]
MRMAKSLHLFISLFLLLLYVSLQVQSHSFDDCSLLLDFKNNISTNKSASSDPRSYPKLASWTHNTSEGKSYCCSWDGVECSDKTTGHVVVLDLSSSFLYGPINSTTTLFSLIHLRTLNLADNNFRSSQIPSAIGRLSQLANLNLSFSGFIGHVPKDISQLTQLVSLDLTGNSLLKFQGSVFRNLVQNSTQSLRELFLSRVNIDSQVPDILANSSSLRSLSLGDCGLHGKFPTSIFHLPNLQLLHLQDNSDLTGYLPTFHGNSQLKSLALAGTNFLGKVPPSIGNLIHLEQLDLYNCSFLGPLPRSVGNLTQLIKLDLDYNNMVGQIPSSVTNLTHLTYLSLKKNDFTGIFPCLESLSNLTYLCIRGNNFDRWKLPDWLGKLNKLIVLSLIDVNLYGEIPSSIFNLTKLEELNLLSNQIEGPFPPFLSTMTKLIILELANNQLTGPIPPFPRTMTKLRILDLANNQLTGPIPSSLSDLKNLEIVQLRNNNISGTVEADIFLSLKKLKVLSLGRNKITLSAISNHTIDTLPKFTALEFKDCNLRVFPDFLRSQVQLEILYLDNNRIDGLIPEWMGNVGKETLQVLTLSQNSLMGFEHHSLVVPWIALELLDLSYNKLHGSIPMPPPTTRIFQVSNNKLTGEIPRAICDLKSLQFLDLSFNNINGPINRCLEKLIDSLLVLNLRGNTLQGTIPNIFMAGSNLVMIDLSENMLKGQLPRSLENCTSLQILDLGNNHMKGMFPFWLGALPELQVLILRSNNFHGAIRIPSKSNPMFRKLRIIDLSHNSFSGDLPNQYFAEWLAMKETDSNAKYMEAISIESGSYTCSMKFINKGVSTEYEKIINSFIAIDLSSNKFEGKISETIKSLIGLRSLNLSNNELSGAIPSSMKNLTLLESLDLSGNKLSGKIPQKFTQLNFLEFLNLSYNNLDGPIPQGGQFNTFSNISYMGNFALCGDPLSKKCGNSETSRSMTVSLNKDIESDFPSGIDWVVILFGVASGLVIGLLFGNDMAKRFYEWMLRRFMKRE